MSTKGELQTITTTLEDVSRRLTQLVDHAGSVPTDLYSELVAAERTIGTLLRRLNRASSRLGDLAN